MIACRVTASAAATPRAGARPARGVAARRGASAATGSGRSLSVRHARVFHLSVRTGRSQTFLRAEQSSGNKVSSEDAALEAAAPLKDEEQVLDLPSQSDSDAQTPKEEKSLGDQIREMKNKGVGGAGDPDASSNIFVGALEEIGEVEWPTAGAALQTTGIVIAIVVGSTFVLLSVNSVLSAVSQTLFG
jgi:preprotein translocase SecE subunit